MAPVGIGACVPWFLWGILIAKVLLPVFSQTLDPPLFEEVLPLNLCIWLKSSILKCKYVPDKEITLVIFISHRPLAMRTPFIVKPVETGL